MNSYQKGFTSRMLELGFTDVDAAALLYISEPKSASAAPDPVGEFMQTVSKAMATAPGTQHPLIKLKMSLVRGVISRAASAAAGAKGAARVG